MNQPKTLRASIRSWMVFFIIALILSGITAFAIETGLGWICSWWPSRNTSLYYWLSVCYNAMRDMNNRYPFLAYGYDWLAFAHIAIALFFVGPLKDPVRNIWIIEAGRIACILIIPLAFFAGAIRGIPVYWRIIDCSFGVLGLIPLTICYKKTRQLEKLILHP